MTLSGVAQVVGLWSEIIYETHLPSCQCVDREADLCHGSKRILVSLLQSDLGVLIR